MSVPHESEKALVALTSASAATAQLAAYVTEGPELADWAFGEHDVTPQLVEALVRVAEIELGCYERKPQGMSHEIRALKALIAAATLFLHDWNGQ